MSNQRFRALLSYLPGMAAVVNSFQSPEVQQKVYEDLMQALNVKLDGEGAGPETKSRATENGSAGKNGDLMQDLAEGGSIHSDLTRV